MAGFWMSEVGCVQGFEEGRDRLVMEMIGHAVDADGQAFDLPEAC